MEGQRSSGGGDLAAGDWVIVPFLGLDHHAAKSRRGTAEANRNPRADCSGPGDGPGGLFDGSEGSEMGVEGSDEAEEAEETDGNGHAEKVDKGKGKERAEDETWTERRMGTETGMEAGTGKRVWRCYSSGTEQKST